MKKLTAKINNQIWYNSFLCLANNFIFNLKDKEKDFGKFSAEQVYNVLGVCGDVEDKIKILKFQIEKEIEKDELSKN